LVGLNESTFIAFGSSAPAPKSSGLAMINPREPRAESREPRAEQATRVKQARSDDGSERRGGEKSGV